MRKLTEIAPATRSRESNSLLKFVTSLVSLINVPAIYVLTDIVRTENQTEGPAKKLAGEAGKEENTGSFRYEAFIPNTRQDLAFTVGHSEMKIRKMLSE